MDFRRGELAVGVKQVHDLALTAAQILMWTAGHRLLKK
jgi:hypothetical protein